MSLAPLLVSAASSGLSGINPFVVGGSVLLLLTLVMLGLLSFGAGRPHS
jgi:hypothetical protein